MSCLNCGLNVCCCNTLATVELSQFGELNNIASGTLFVTSTNNLVSAKTLSQFILRSKPPEVIEELTAEQNQVSNVDTYICNGTFDINLLEASKAKASLNVIVLSGNVTVVADTNQPDLINGNPSVVVGANEWLTITPYSAGWVAKKVSLL